MADEGHDITKEQRAAAVNASYSAAVTWLIGQHKADFNQYRKNWLRNEHGIDWSPKPTQAEKDEAALAEILARNPGLVAAAASVADRLGAKPVVDGHS